MRLFTGARCELWELTFHRNTSTILRTLEMPRVCEASKLHNLFPMLEPKSFQLFNDSSLAERGVAADVESAPDPKP